MVLNVFSISENNQNLTKNFYDKYGIISIFGLLRNKSCIISTAYPNFYNNDFTLFPHWFQESGLVYHPICQFR